MNSSLHITTTLRRTTTFFINMNHRSSHLNAIAPRIVTFHHRSSIPSSPLLQDDCRIGSFEGRGSGGWMDLWGKGWVLKERLDFLIKGFLEKGRRRTPREKENIRRKVRGQGHLEKWNRVWVFDLICLCILGQMGYWLRYMKWVNELLNLN